MFFLIGVAGSRPRKSKAAFYLFFYTLVGSLCMLISITVLYLSTETSRYDLIIGEPIISYGFYGIDKEYFYFLLFFFAFAIKTPVFPFHL